MLMVVWVELFKINIRIMWLQIQAGRWCGVPASAWKLRHKQGAPLPSSLLFVLTQGHSFHSITEWTTVKKKKKKRTVEQQHVCDSGHVNFVHSMHPPHARWALHAGSLTEAPAVVLKPTWQKSATPQHSAIPRPCVTRELPVSVTSESSSGDALSDTGGNSWQWITRLLLANPFAFLPIQ